MPQFYLRNFATRDGQVLLVDRDVLTRAFATAVRKACAEVGFYRLNPDTFVVEDESQRPDPELVEQHLSQFERAAAPAVYKLVKTGLNDINQDDWYHLINFIALQSVRGNRFREDIEAIGTQALRTYLGEHITDEQIGSWLEERGDPVTPASISGFRETLVGPKRPRLIPPKEYLIQESIKLALGQLGERLADDMNWSIIEADRASVLTSDEPVCWWAPGDGPVGYGSARVVWMPVSRRRILQLRDNTADPESLGLSAPNTPAGRDALVRFVNAQVATQSHRWIVHHPDDRPLEDIVVGARTAWSDELVSVEEDGRTRRELSIHRRLPVSGEPGVVTPRRTPRG
ncbi:DUF4238 domain-containing protein [Georgenia sp. M64]|uniref:DUF4238 domain-containing protein n=1 Tax=Georgenia sp. M64 TaxID=3120520 RepID=UPI0030E3873D